jgi:RHS repeat-associated protein
LNYIFSDPIDFPLLTTNSTGATATWGAEAKAFGEIWTSSGTAPFVRFPGQWAQRFRQQSSDTRIYDNAMRVYAPQKGRYQQVDPLAASPSAVYGDGYCNPESESIANENLSRIKSEVDFYMYAANDSLNNVDPLGLRTYTIGACAYRSIGWAGASNHISKKLDRVVGNNLLIFCAKCPPPEKPSNFRIAPTPPKTNMFEVLPTDASVPTWLKSNDCPCENGTIVNVNIKTRYAWNKDRVKDLATFYALKYDCDECE